MGLAIVLNGWDFLLVDFFDNLIMCYAIAHLIGASKKFKIWDYLLYVIIPSFFIALVPFFARFKLNDLMNLIVYFSIFLGFNAYAFKEHSNYKFILVVSTFVALVYHLIIEMQLILLIAAITNCIDMNMVDFMTNHRFVVRILNVYCKVIPFFAIIMVLKYKNLDLTRFRKYFKEDEIKNKEE